MAIELYVESATYRPRSCFTESGHPKRRYPTKGEAMRAAARIEESACVEMTVYVCRYCGGIHIGKRPEWLV